ncbi:inner centromere protein [Dromiciops gliroides]|uniref:inner centromere protein n=1 Tax=Dromiciops gliroides TaxID=33562 RepID=UPI001CC5FD63|nr:inner centromere protein [Dromiciops gliroides]XP_043829193.1 inner centromere protein [Dromiciops gliroides]
MGTTTGPASILEVCSTKLMEFICNVDNKDMVWLQEIKEEALKMFSSDFSVEPELMPKTPSQRNRRRKKRLSSIQDENKPPTRKRLSRRESRRNSRHNSRLLRSKDRLEKLVLVVAENGSIPRGARTPVAAPSPPESPTVLTPKSMNLPAVGSLVPVVEIGVREQRSAEKCLKESQARTADQELSFVIGSGRKDKSLPEQQAGSPAKPAPGTLLVAPTTGLTRSVAKLRIARPAPSEDTAAELGGVPSSPETQPQSETELLLDLPESPRTPTGSRCDRRSVRRSLVRKTSKAPRVSLINKYSMVPQKISPVRRSSRKLAREPAATGRIICHSYLERLLDVEVPRKASSEEEVEQETEAEPEVPEGTRRTLRPRNANKIAISTPRAQPESGAQDDRGSESKTDQSEELREPPQSVRRKRSYKQAISEPDETGEHADDDEALTPPREKTLSPVCPPSKVVRPLRTFLHTVQKNQLLMTPTSASRTSVMKSFIKRNTPHHMDAKEKERQRLETLKKKEEAELLRKQKVEEDKRRRLEEVKMKREERLRKVLQARERAEQLEVEKKKRIEQKLAQLEKNEKAKEERLAEEKARKKAAAKKQEEAEARRKQEEEVRRQKRLQQEEEERRHQEQLQKKKEEEQERLRKLAEARRIVEQQKQREQQLALEREMERKREQERLQAERERQEKERALRLQKERSQRELEEKRKREERLRQEQERKRLQEEQEKKAKEAAASAVGASNKFLNVTVDVQSPVCNSYEMTPQGPKGGPKINPDNYGMDLNSDDSTDDETQPRKPIPAWANGTQLSQAVIRQYYQPPDVDQLFGTILSPRLEDIFNKSKPRYHKRTSSAVWHSPPLPGSRPLVGLPYGLKKP